MVSRLLRDIDEYQGSVFMRYALRLAPIAFVRPEELRKAECSEIDMEQAEGRIPAEKMDTNHIVPLSTQALAILEEIKPLTGKGKYVFLPLRTSLSPMSEKGSSHSRSQGAFRAGRQGTGPLWSLGLEGVEAATPHGQGLATVGGWNMFYTRFIRLLTIFHERSDEAGKFVSRLRSEMENLWLFLQGNGEAPTNYHAEGKSLTPRARCRRGCRTIDGSADHTQSVFRAE